jgi:hypothetical protein
MTVLRFELPAAGPWDLAGIGASLLCILHCLTMPALVVVLPTLEMLERPTHAAFALGILCIGMLAFIPGYRRHRRWRVVLLGLIGLGLLSAGVLVPEGGLSEGAETGLTVLGGTLLIAAHLRNGYLCHFCPGCGGEPCVDDVAECSPGR